MTARDPTPGASDARSDSPARGSAKERQLDRLLVRFGLVVSGALCWRAATLLWHAGMTPTSGPATALMLGGYLLGFIMLAAAAVGARSRRVRHLVPAALVWVAAVWVLVHLFNQRAGGHPSTTDALIYSDYAARLLLEGHNPYASDLSAAYRLHRLPMFFVTSLVDGDFTGRAAYPALSFLPFVPLLAAGIPTEWLYPACLGVSLVLVYCWSPRRYQPVVLLPLFVDQSLFLYSLGGVTDAVWVLLLVIVIRYWDRPVIRAVVFGLACAYKHQPWVLAPYLLIRIGHEATGGRRDRVRAAAKFAGASAAVFLGVNFPFLVWDPLAWLTGVTEPMRAAMVTYGQGLSTLSMIGVAPVPKSVFTAFRLTIWAVTLVVYYRQLPRIGALVWLLPAFVLWFGHRSLTSYWYFNLVPFVFALALQHRGERVASVPASRHWRWDLAAVTATLVGMAATTGVFAARNPSLNIRTVGPIGTTGAEASTMTVEVHNTGDRPARPRFTVQSRGTQPFYWTVQSGPRAPLAPGNRARYRIERTAAFAGFDLLRGGRLTVVDADDGDRTATTVLPHDEAYVHPDRIPNGSFRFWEGGAPTFWGFVDECGSGATLALVEPATEGAPATALRMVLAPSAGQRCAYLDTYLFVPDRTVRLWVKRPSRTGTPEDGLPRYGLRLVLGDGVLWILFGTDEASGQLGPKERYLVLPAPTDVWHLQQLELPHLLARAGLDAGAWRTPVARFDHLDVPSVAANLQLVVRFGPGDGPVEAVFGPIHTSNDDVLDQRFRDDLEHPQEHLFWRAELDLAMWNYDKAMERARRGLATAPNAGRAHLTLAEAAFWSHDLDVAAAHYRRAADLGYAPGLALKGLGWVRHGQRRFGDAIRAWEQALGVLGRSTDPGALVHAADCLRGMAKSYVQTQRCDDAVELLRRARNEFPGIRLPLKDVESCPAAADLREP